MRPTRAQSPDDRHASAKNAAASAAPSQRKTALICCGHSDAAEQLRLTAERPGEALTFLPTVAHLARLRETRPALSYDTVILNLPPGSDWAEPVLQGWSLLAENGRLMAVVPKDWRQATGPHVVAVKKIISRFGRCLRVSRRARRAGVPVGSVVLVCVKPGPRNASWWQRALRKSR